MIDCNENENDNGKVHHINNTNIQTKTQTQRQIQKIQRVSVRQYIYVINNTYATFEAQFIKKLSNTEADLEKSIAYKKACNKGISDTHPP